MERSPFETLKMLKIHMETMWWRKWQFMGGTSIFVMVAQMKMTLELDGLPLPPQMRTLTAIHQDKRVNKELNAEIVKRLRILKWLMIVNKNILTIGQETNGFCCMTISHYIDDSDGKTMTKNNVITLKYPLYSSNLGDFHQFPWLKMTRRGIILLIHERWW